MTKINKDSILKELSFSASRSSGPGGQNVNKVNTRIELRFNISTSNYLNQYQKQLLLEKLQNRLSSDGTLVITSQKERSQLKNKENAITKLFDILTKAFQIPKQRKATQPTYSSKKKRIASKKIRSITKQNRQKPTF